VSHINRKEAITVLKELVATDLVDPSYVSINEASAEHTELQIKSGYYYIRLQDYCNKKNLNIHNDTATVYIVIS
jgi:hypothetical protein